MLTLSQKFNIIYRHAHKDYKSTIGGVKMLMINVNGRTELASKFDFTDEKIEDLYKYAERKEAQRVEKLSAKKLVTTVGNKS